jgi:hypothetical protein
MTEQKLSTRDLSNTQAREDDAQTGDAVRDEPAKATSEQPLTRDRDRHDPADRHSSGSAPDRSEATAEHEPLLPADQSDRFASRWQEIQASFVDHPREAVVEADTLVADLMQRLAASFSHERDELEGQWDRGDDVSTEDLRVALTRYRSFFERLLSA